MSKPEKDSQELEQAVANLESVETDADVQGKDVDVVVKKAEELQAEEKLEEATTDRLKKTFVTHEKLEVLPEPEKESDDSTPEKEEKPADETDDKDGPTAAEKKEEAKLKATTKAGEKKDDESVQETDDKAKDEDADKSKSKKKDIPPLSDAYVRAAIHRGWTEEDVTKAYETNPELTVTTLGNIYEALNRSSKEYAAFGRAAKQQAVAKVAPQSEEGTEKKSEFKGVDIEKLRTQYPDDPVVELVESMQTQNKALFDEVQKSKITKSAPATGQPSGLNPEQVRAVEQEAAAVEQQIETFFKNDSLKGYEEFYGVLPKDAADWNSLIPGQKMNRWAVIEMMDQMIAGARSLGREMKIDEALNLSHLSVTEPIREKVIREGIKAKVTKRSSNLTLKPSGTAQPGKTKPQTKEDLENVTAERLGKMNW